MSVVARLTVPADQFPLGEVLEVRSGSTVRVESMIPTGDAVVPYFWVPSGDADAVETALADSSLVDAVHHVDEVGGEALFRVGWSDDVNGLIDAIGATDGAVLEAEGTGDDWSFRMRFPEHEQLSQFYQHCVDEGIPLELAEVNDPVGTGARDEFGLTDGQREALELALSEGYYAVPREITLADLAAELGVSDTAVSQRLRRGLRTVLDGTVGE